jgi:N-acetylneuraminate synthase
MQDSLSNLVRDLAERCPANQIFILGKGPSLDEIDLASVPPGVLINLNDSERVKPGDVAIFSANWVRHSLAEDGFDARFYLAGKSLPAEVPHVVLPPTPLELDHEEMNILRLEQPDFFDESFVLLNAIKLSLAIAKRKNQPLEVFLLGFDFSTSAGATSQKMTHDYSGAQQGERQAIIASQEQAYRQFLHYFESGNLLRLHHVGNKDFSSYSTALFNRQICQTAGFATRSTIDLANPGRVLVVAELTNNHLGDPDRLVEMIERSKEAGADLIKVQKRDVDGFYTQDQLNSYYWSPFGKTLGDYRRGVELNDSMFDLLDETCRKNDIEWFSTILDLPSYHSIKRFNPRLLKVPSTISNHRAFHQELAKVYQGAIVVSTGFTEQEYVDYVLETFAANEVIYLLHCISAYPAPRNSCNIAVVRAYEHLRKRFARILPGYSSHDLGNTGCMLAVACGARMLEKHVKLGDVDWIHFDKVAIDLATDEFKRFVQDVRLAEEITGNETKAVLECEHHKYPVKD